MQVFLAFRWASILYSIDKLNHILSVVSVQYLTKKESFHHSYTIFFAHLFWLGITWHTFLIASPVWKEHYKKTRNLQKSIFELLTIPLQRSFESYYCTTQHKTKLHFILSARLKSLVLNLKPVLASACLSFS